MKALSKRFNKAILGLTPGAERLLMHAAWPGNVRELRNTIERACLLGEGPMLSERDIVIAEPAEAAEPARPGAAARLGVPLDADQVRQALAQAGGNKAEAARALGLSRRAFYRRLEAFGLR